MGRLASIEAKVGIETNSVHDAASNGAKPKPADEDSPAVEAYKKHMSTFISPLIETCNALAKEDPKMKDIGTSILNAWEGIGTIVALASKCKKPSGAQQNFQQALMPYLKQTQDAISGAQKVRLSRDFDNHQKALMEMFSAVSWVLMSPPPVSPSNHVKETVGAMEFYSNKVRKQYKGMDGKEAHIAFCDQSKALILDLTEYTKKHHSLGLAFNAHGCATLEEGAKILEKSKKKEPSKVTPSAVGGIGALMSELATKQTSDGASAATGLRKVTKEQQTWRKEFNAVAAGEVKAPPSSPSIKPAANKTTTSPARPPLCEFDQIGQKWKVEYQTKDTNPLLKLTIGDVKEQVYIYKCSNMTIEITGKLKAIVVDGCQKVNVVFGTAISGLEVVNSKSIQVQTLGMCPTMSIDKTDGFMVYLSKESMETISFMTSKSSEMNVSWPDDKGEMLETPIPEQFQHRLVNGSIKSTVSDLYH